MDFPILSIGLFSLDVVPIGRRFAKQGEYVVAYAEPLRSCHNAAMCRLLDEHGILELYGIKANA